MDVRAPDCTGRDKFRFMRSILISPCTSSAPPAIKMQICLRGRNVRQRVREKEEYIIKPALLIHKRRSTLSVCMCGQNLISPGTVRSGPGNKISHALLVRWVRFGAPCSLSKLDLVQTMRARLSR